MKTSSDYKPSTSFGLLLQGPPGSGKTTIAMCFPTPYFADCDNNLSGAVRRLKDKKFFYDVIDVGDDGKEVAEEKRWTRLTECCKKAFADPNIKTIVVDSLSKAADYLISHILYEQKQANMRIQDWGIFKILMTRFITFLRSGGKLCIVTSHEKYDKDEVSGVLYYRTNCPGSLADNIGALFSDVWRCECAEAKRDEYKFVVRSMPTPRMSLKNSLGLPTTFEFSWEEFAKKLGN